MDTVHNSCDNVNRWPCYNIINSEVWSKSIRSTREGWLVHSHGLRFKRRRVKNGFFVKGGIWPWAWRMTQISTGKMWKRYYKSFFRFFHGELHWCRLGTEIQFPPPHPTQALNSGCLWGNESAHKSLLQPVACSPHRSSSKWNQLSYFGV